MLVLMSAILWGPFTACDRWKKDDVFTAEEAKSEIRMAGQQVRRNMDDMMEVKAMQALQYLMKLLSGEGDTGPKPDPDTKSPNRFCLTALYLEIFELTGLTKEIAGKDEHHGVYRYNFNTGSFDLVDFGGNYLRYIFPANDAARENRMHNASFTIENLAFMTVTYPSKQEPFTEDLLISASTDLVVDNQTLSTFSHEAGFTTSGLPVATDMKLTMHPYQLRLSLSGTGRDYSSTMSLTKNDQTLMSYHLSLRYNVERDAADRVAGLVQIVPLRFEGGINMVGVRSCEQPHDIECMNPHLDIDVKQTVYNKSLGHLAYGLQCDPDTGMHHPTMQIVYKDGTSDPLTIIFDDKPTGITGSLSRIMNP